MDRFLKWRCHGCSVYNSSDDKNCSICKLPRGTPTPQKASATGTNPAKKRKLDLPLVPSTTNNLPTSAGKPPPTIFPSMYRNISLPQGWVALNTSVLLRSYGYKGKDNVKCKIKENEYKWCGFDFDATLVARTAGTLCFPTIEKVLKGLEEQGFRIVIFSNEGMAHLKTPQAVKKTTLNKIKRVDSFLERMGVDMEVYLATARDNYRKPSKKDTAKYGASCGGTGMFSLFKEDPFSLGFKNATVDMANSLFVGDAAGRRTDFSDADKAFAKAVGVKFYLPEEFFANGGAEHVLGITSREAERKRLVVSSAVKKQFVQTIDQLPVPIVFVLVGVQGSGKSTLAEKMLEALGDARCCYISQDMTKSATRSIHSVTNALSDEKAKVIIMDRTNYKQHMRAEVLRAMKQFKCLSCAIHLHVDVQECIKRCSTRRNHPGGFSSEKLNYSSLSNRILFFNEQLSTPTTDEGFDYVLKMHCTYASIDQIIARVDSVLTVENELPVYQIPTSPPPPFTGIGKVLREYLRAAVPSYLSDRVYYCNAEFVVIYDAYPKAQVHLLVIPRPQVLACKDLESLVTSQPAAASINASVVSSMHTLANRVMAHLQSTQGGTYRAGYHLVPSLEPLHLHIISQDFNSSCLKTKKHWNSFATEFFVPSDKVMQLVSNSGTDQLSKLLKRSDEFLGMELRCHRCGEVCTNMPVLRKHIEGCKVECKKACVEV